MRVIISIAFVMSLFLFLPSGYGLFAQIDPNSPNGARPKNEDRSKKLYDANLVKYKSLPDMLVLPGLLANRKEKRIEVLTESTGLKGNDVAEFLIVDQNSGHGYESLLWSFAKPSDIHKALAFIGIKPGEPFNPDKLRFRPKGELIYLSISRKDGPSGVPTVRLENMIQEKQKEKPLPESGFVFTGSIQVSAPEGQTGLTYAADTCEPKSIVSLYNEPTTVLDVPRQANQGEVYNNQVVNPDFVFDAGELLTLIMEPARKDGISRIKDIVLEISANRSKPEKADKTSRQPGQESPFNFLLKDSDGKTLGKSPTIEDALAAFTGLSNKGFDPYLSIRFDNTLKLTEIHKICLILSLIESGMGISIEPPAKGHLYYKAFLPDERWRERENRIAQPWELHISRNKDKVSGTLYQNEEIWGDDNSITPKIKTTSFEVPSPKALREQLDADAKKRKLAGKRPDLAVLLVFADPELSYGELMNFIETALSTHNTVHVFLPVGN